MSAGDTTVKDLEFLQSLTTEQIDPYRGEWVAINDGKNMHNWHNFILSII